MKVLISIAQKAFGLSEKEIKSRLFEGEGDDQKLVEESKIIAAFLEWDAAKVSEFKTKITQSFEQGEKSARKKALSKVDKAISEFFPNVEGSTTLEKIEAAAKAKKPSSKVKDVKLTTEYQELETRFKTSETTHKTAIEKLVSNHAIELAQIESFGALRTDIASRFDDLKVIATNKPMQVKMVVDLIKSQGYSFKGENVLKDGEAVTDAQGLTLKKSDFIDSQLSIFPKSEQDDGGWIRWRGAGNPNPPKTNNVRTRQSF